MTESTFIDGGVSTEVLSPAINSTSGKGSLNGRDYPTNIEKMFETFHQSPHGDFKPTFYNPFEVKHRRRTTKAQYSVLEEAYQENNKPSATARKVIANELGMTARSVQVWFQNRRAKDKGRLGGSPHFELGTLNSTNSDSSSPDMRASSGGVMLANIAPQRPLTQSSRKRIATSCSIERINNDNNDIERHPSRNRHYATSMSRRHSMPDMQQPSPGRLPFRELHEAIFGKNILLLNPNTVQKSTNIATTISPPPPSSSNSSSTLILPSLQDIQERCSMKNNSNYLLPYYQYYMNSLPTMMPNMMNHKQSDAMLSHSADSSTSFMGMDPMLGSGLASTTATSRFPQRARSQGDLRAPSISAPESSPCIYSFAPSTGAATPSEVYQQLREFIQIANTPGATPPAVNHILVDRVVNDLESFSPGELGILLEETSNSTMNQHHHHHCSTGNNGELIRAATVTANETTTADNPAMIDFFAHSNIMVGDCPSHTTNTKVDMTADLQELLLPNSERCSPGDPMFHSMVADQYFFPPDLTINPPFN